MLFVRCLRCKRIAMGPDDLAVQLCVSCYTQNLERARATGELERVQREAWGRELRRSLRAERRLRWIQDGGALSDSFSEDTIYQDDLDYTWDWGQDDDMNYSSHS